MRRVLLIGLVIAWTFGCAQAGTDRIGPTGIPFGVEDIAASGEEERLSRNRADFGHCSLVVLAAGQGFDFSSPEGFLHTMRKHPRGGKNDRSVGHSWLVLNGPLTWLEGGHTGEFDEVHPNYSLSVAAAIKLGDPNPLACLWTNRGLGRFEVGSGGHIPSAAVRFELTTNQYAAIRAFIDGYDFKNFNLRDHVCTHFVARAAARAGLTLGHQVTLNIPKQTRFMGRHVIWWTNPAYSRITVGSPDVLEKSLKLAVEKGLGRDVLKEYQRR